MKRLQSEKLKRLRARHLRGAIVRSGASLTMWLVTLTAYFTGTIQKFHFIGISASVCYLLIMGPPLLFALRYMTSRRSYEYYSLLINQLEIFGYTAIIYFSGGIEASYLMLVYAALIAYVGVVAPRRHSFIVAGLCILTFGAMIALVSNGILPHPTVLYESIIPMRMQMFILVSVIGLLYVVAYISATTANLLKTHRAELARQNRALGEANQKMRIEVEEREQAEEALRESEARFRSLVENTIYGHFTLEPPSGRFLFLNWRFCELFGYPMHEALRSTVWEFLGPNENAPFGITLQELLKGSPKGNGHGSYIAVRKDRSTFQAEMNLFLVKSHGRNVVHGMVRDVTEENKLAERLELARRMESIGTLAGGIAHNFNNLLMGIRGNASLAALNLHPSDPTHRNLQIIERLVQNGSRLTDQLIGYAREGRYEVKPLDLNQVIQEVSAAFWPMRREITVRQECEPGLLRIEADRDQMEQVLLTLFMNAADAMPSGGYFFVSTENITHEDMGMAIRDPKPGHYVRMTVKDTGVGMDESTLDHLFEPFFTTKGLGGGTGLGLASTYGIIKGHEGFIEVRSRKGEGTVFQIYLPAAEQVSPGGVFSCPDREVTRKI